MIHCAITAKQPLQRYLKRDTSHHSTVRYTPRAIGKPKEAVAAASPEVATPRGMKSYCQHRAMQRFTLTIEVSKYSYGVIRELFGPQFRPRFPELGTVELHSHN